MASRGLDGISTYDGYPVSRRLVGSLPAKQEPRNVERRKLDCPAFKVWQPAGVAVHIFVYYWKLIFRY